LRPHFGDDLLGPDRPAVARVQYRHLRQLLLKVAPTLSAAGVRRTLLSARDVLLAQPAYRNVGLHFDVDPM
jgi:primosomal protein N' (replication factor Y)